MSFEGYYQIICGAGHLSSMDCYGLVDPSFWACSEIVEGRQCAYAAQWWNLVDVTNGSEDDEGNRIDGYIELKPKKAAMCVCGSCGHQHRIEPPLYEPPKEGGHLCGESSVLGKS